MTSRDYVPSPPSRVGVRKDGERWTLVFTRDLRHPPERVWDALTDPAELHAWAPFDPDRNLGTIGNASLTMAGGDGGEEDTLPAVVRRAERPHLLEYTWGDDLLRWELASHSAGTRLTLYHTVDDANWTSKTAAGWHICLDVAERLLDGAPVGRIVGEDAKSHGWSEFESVYAAALKSESVSR